MLFSSGESSEMGCGGWGEGEGGGEGKSKKKCKYLNFRGSGIGKNEIFPSPFPRIFRWRLQYCSSAR